MKITELWIADIFDYYFEAPYLVGVYSTEQQAWDAISIVINRCMEKDPGGHPESRFNSWVTPVQLNGFTPACIDWLGYA